MGSKKGRIITWGDKISLANRGENHPMYGKHHSAEAKKKMSLHNLEHPRRYWLGKKRPSMTGDKHPKPMLGKKLSLEVRQKMSNAHLLRREKNHLWKGGITPINQQIRTSFEYKQWRNAVYKRDNYTCVWCGSKESGRLNADHIKPFALYPDLRFDINNGRTLCIDCHKQTDSYLNRDIKISYHLS